MMPTFPQAYRIHHAPAALLVWLKLRKPLSDDGDAIAIVRDLLRRHPELDPNAYNWLAASVIPRERRAYVVRLAHRSTTFPDPPITAPEEVQ